MNKKHMSQLSLTETVMLKKEESTEKQMGKLT